MQRITLKEIPSVEGCFYLGITSRQGADSWSQLLMALCCNGASREGTAWLHTDRTLLRAPGRRAQTSRLGPPEVASPPPLQLPGRVPPPPPRWTLLWSPPPRSHSWEPPDLLGGHRCPAGSPRGPCQLGQAEPSGWPGPLYVPHPPVHGHSIPGKTPERHSSPCSLLKPASPSLPFWGGGGLAPSFGGVR